MGKSKKKEEINFMEFSNPYTNIMIPETDIKEITIINEPLKIEPEIVSIQQELIIQKPSIPVSSTHYAKRNVEVLKQPSNIAQYSARNDVFKARPDRPVKNV